jgi:hypothetical protein
MGSQLLLILASAVILSSEFARFTMTFYCLRFETPSTWRARFPYLYPPGTGWPSYTPRHWVLFSSSPITQQRGCHVVFVSAGTRLPCCCLAINVYFDLTIRLSDVISQYDRFLPDILCLLFIVPFDVIYSRGSDSVLKPRRCFLILSSLHQFHPRSSLSLGF